MGFDSKSFFCRAFPSLQPASGGGQRVEYVDREHPIWAVLREKWKVETIPDFLKHLFNKHDGEARLIEEGDWMPLEDEDVRHPAFWSSQFARTEAPRAAPLCLWRSCPRGGGAFAGELPCAAVPDTNARTRRGTCAR